MLQVIPDLSATIAMGSTSQQYIYYTYIHYLYTKLNTQERHTPKIRTQYANRTTGIRKEYLSLYRCTWNTVIHQIL